MEPSATSTTVTGPVGERLQAGTEDADELYHEYHIYLVYKAKNLD